MKTVSRRHTELFLLMAVMALGLAVLACSASPTPTKEANVPRSTQTVSRASANCVQGIIPGETTRDEVIGQLGEPASTEANDGQEILLYSAKRNGEYHSIIIQNDLVGLVSVILDDAPSLLWSEVAAQYGNPAITTYSYFLQGSQTFIFPERGEAFVASPELDIVYARECFVSITAENYMNSWGSSLPTENPFTK